MDNELILSSEGEDEDAKREVPLWAEVMKYYNLRKEAQLRVPGLRPHPPYQVLSSLTQMQHCHCMTVLCARNSHVLPQKFLPRPSQDDYRIFKNLQKMYIEEQDKYIKWAKYLWFIEHSRRALWLLSPVERTYESEVTMRARRLDGYPIYFDLVNHIPLRCLKGHHYHMQRKVTLIPVNLSDLPEVELPKQLDKSTNIIRECPVPEPCPTHPCAFILPNKDTVSTLAIPKIHWALAHYAANKGARFIASESALRCLVQCYRCWTMTVSAYATITTDGKKGIVLVLGSEIIIDKEPSMIRTYKAFKHLLEDRLITREERERVKQKYQSKKANASVSKAADNAALNTSKVAAMNDQGLIIEGYDDDDKICRRSKHTIAEGVPPPNGPEHSNADEETIIIIEDDINPTEPIKNPQEFNITNANDVASTASNEEMASTASNKADTSGVQSRTCIGTPYKVPPPRSYVMWDIKNSATDEKIAVIIHCAHKAKANDSSEIILEPIPEYQLELGGSEQPPDRLRGIVLALLLRQNASLLNVRIDGCNGEMVRLDKYPAEEFLQQHDDIQQQVVNAIYAALSKLHEVKPGHYLLQHKRAYGKTARLYASVPNSTDMTMGIDRINNIHIEKTNEALLKNVPIITPVLLPIHKHNMQLPCTYTPDPKKFHRGETYETNSIFNFYVDPNNNK